MLNRKCVTIGHGSYYVSYPVRTKILKPFDQSVEEMILDDLFQYFYVMMIDSITGGVIIGPSDIQFGPIQRMLLVNIKENFHE